jgi:hypothetical protein
MSRSDQNLQAKPENDWAKNRVVEENGNRERSSWRPSQRVTGTDCRSLYSRNRWIGNSSKAVVPDLTDWPFGAVLPRL